MSTIRPATSYQRRAAQNAARLLSQALTCARVADCPKLITRIEAAVASAGGAVRHVEHRLACTRPTYGVIHPMWADRAAFANVESPWFRKGQYA